MMRSSFELFDLVSGNVYDDYDRESDAIDALLEILLNRGPGEVARFALSCDQGDESALIAMEHDLVRLVEAKKNQLIRPQS